MGTCALGALGLVVGQACHMVMWSKLEINFSVNHTLLVFHLIVQEELKSLDKIPKASKACSE